MLKQIEGCLKAKNNYSEELSCFFNNDNDIEQ